MTCCGFPDHVYRLPSGKIVAAPEDHITAHLEQRSDGPIGAHRAVRDALTATGHIILTRTEYNELERDAAIERRRRLHE
jgi:hypothetical protein